MKTAEDILKSKLNNTQWNYLHHVLHSGEVYKQILAGMEEYAEQQVKNCNTPAVSKSLLAEERSAGYNEGWQNCLDAHGLEE